MNIVAVVHLRAGMMRCSIIMVVDGQYTGAGAAIDDPDVTVLPAAAGGWTVTAAQGGALRFLVARPVF